MAKFKNISGELRRFTLNGKEKIVDAGHSFSAEPNDYLLGATELGFFEMSDDEPQAADVKKSESPKNSGN